MDVQTIKRFFDKHTGVVLLLVATLVYFILAQHFGILIWDEAAYLGNAASHLEVSHFTEDFRFPLLEWTITLVWFIFGKSLVLARLLMSFFSGALVLVTYLLAKHVVEKKWRLLIALLSATLPLMFFWSFRIYADIAGVAAALFGIYYALEHKPVASGFFFAASFLFRFSLVLYAIPVGLYLLYNKDIKNFLRTLLGAGILLIPWMLYNYVQYGNPLWDVFAQGKVIATYTTAQSVQLFLEPFLQNIFPLVLGLVGLWFIKKEQQKIVLILGSGVLLQVILHVFVIRLKLARYFLTITSIVIILSVYGFYLVTTKIRQEDVRLAVRAVFLAFVFASMIAGIHVQLEHMRYAQKCNDAVREANAYLAQYPPGTEIISNQWPLFAFENNFNSTSTWTTYTDQLLWRMMPDKVILAYPGGLEQDLSAYQNHQWLRAEKSFQSVCPEYSVHIFDMSWIDPVDVIYKGPLPD